MEGERTEGHIDRSRRDGETHIHFRATFYGESGEVVPCHWIDASILRACDSKCVRDLFEPVEGVPHVSYIIVLLPHISVLCVVVVVTTCAWTIDLVCRQVYGGARSCNSKATALVRMLEAGISQRTIFFFGRSRRNIYIIIF